MTQQNMLAPYWVFKRYLSDELCELVLKERLDMQEIEAKVGAGNGTLNKDIRVTKLRYAQGNYWLEGVLYNCGLYACENAAWGYQLGRPEPVQIGDYVEGGYYGFHADTILLEMSPTVRKVSVVALLNEPSDFEGGEFEFEEFGAFAFERGDVVVFPSAHRHRVKPVTRGLRNSAVLWIRGPRA
jgi:PKHD-type hydroxylase